jgi:hypothetical protein
MGEAARVASATLIGRRGRRDGGLIVSKLRVTMAIAVVVLAVVAAAARPARAPAALGPCGSTWARLASPTSGTGANHLYGVGGSSGSDVWAAGWKATSTVDHTLIEHWTGSSWAVTPSPSPGPLGSYLYGVDGDSTSNAWAVGVKHLSSNGNDKWLASIERWNGSTWSSVVTPKPPKFAFQYLYDVATVPSNEAWAVGVNGLGGNAQPQTLVLWWSGSAWTAMLSGNPSAVSDSLAGVGTDSVGDAWAVGSYYDQNQANDQPLLEFLSTGGINAEPGPVVAGGGSLGDVAVVSASNVWAVGQRYTGGNTGQTLIEHWDGSNWSIVSSPDLTSNDELTSVTASGPNDVWASGWAVPSIGFREAFTEHWDGSSWSIVSAANPAGGDNYFWGIAAIGGTDWAVGSNGNATLTERICAQPPANQNAPAITGTPEDGQVQTADPGVWSGLPATYAYQWLLCDSGGNACNTIGGATHKTYTAGHGAVGMTLRIEVTATNSWGSTGPVQSDASAVIQAAPPSIKTAPNVTGAPQQGQTLTGTHGVWNGTPPFTYAYQWLDCTGGDVPTCSSIANAHATSYVVKNTDVGFHIELEVTATNIAGHAAARSAPTATVT